MKTEYRDLISIGCSFFLIWVGFFFWFVFFDVNSGSIITRSLYYTPAFFISSAGLAMILLILFLYIRSIRLGNVKEARSNVVRQLTASVEDDSAEIYQSFFNDAPRGGIIIRADGAIMDANQKLADMLGYTREELRGLHVNSLLPEKYRDQHMGLVQAFMATDRGGHPPRTVSALHKNGHELDIDLAVRTISVFDYTGEKVYYGAGITKELES